ncbi:MAG: peptidylprolyl isomerase [Elusimicrobiota bacterium]
MKINLNRVKVFPQVLLFLGVLIPRVFAAEEVVERVIARVNDEPILLTEFKKRADDLIEQYEKEVTGPDREQKLKEFKKRLLDQMIDEKLLIQKAEAEEITVKEEEIDQGMEEIRGRFDSEMDFQNEITKQGLTGENFRENLKQQIRVIKLTNQDVRSKISPPTEDEVKEYYEENKEEMVVPEQVRARHILIKTGDERTENEALKKIEDILSKVKKEPQNFSEFAEEFSEGPSANMGGDLGYFAQREMPESFSEAAFNLNIDEVSEPVKTSFGYHIIKVVGKRSSEKRNFSEIRDRLRNLLYQKKMEDEYEKYLRELRDEAKITKSLFSEQ